MVVDFHLDDHRPVLDVGRRLEARDLEHVEKGPVQIVVDVAPEADAAYSAGPIHDERRRQRAEFVETVEQVRIPGRRRR